MKLWIAGLALLVLVLSAASLSRNLSQGGWYGADGIWHSLDR
jgi:hypothetical protein